MKQFGLLLGLVMLVVGPVASAAHWHDVALKHAEHFLETFEIVDEEFHNYKAPANVIQVTHHVEEVAIGLVDEMKVLTLRQAKEESNHIANDMNEIFPILKSKGYFNYTSLRDAWNHMAQAHKNLSSYLWSQHEEWGSVEMIEMKTF